MGDSTIVSMFSSDSSSNLKEGCFQVFEEKFDPNLSMDDILDHSLML